MRICETTYHSYLPWLSEKYIFLFSKLVTGNTVCFVFINKDFLRQVKALTLRTGFVCVGQSVLY